MNERSEDLKTYYNQVVVDNLKNKFSLNRMAVPKLEKITLNMGLGSAVADKKIIEKAISIMTQISGQKPQMTYAKKSIASFKLREGMPIGCSVTLRKNMMYDFVRKLISVAIPAGRDFRGLNPKSFDGRGNFSMGMKEMTVFPEVDYDKADVVRGMDVTITTSAQNDEQALALLTELGFPFKQKKNN